MLLMPLPIPDVAPCRRFRAGHEKVLEVLLLYLCKVEATCATTALSKAFTITQHDLKHLFHCAKNVLKIIQTGIIIVTDRIIVKPSTLYWQSWGQGFTLTRTLSHGRDKWTKIILSNQGSLREGFPHASGEYTRGLAPCGSKA